MMNPVANGIPLRCLIALAAIDREGSFGRAVEMFSQAQFAVGQQIRRLGDDVGQRLAEHHGASRSR